MKILAATDMTPEGDLALRVAALRFAHERARAGGAALAVVHVTAGRAAEAREALERRAAELTGRTPPELTLFCDEGTAYSEILRRAETWGADLVVVGGRTDTGLLRSLLGGVADKVVRYAHCPVMVARGSGERGHVLAATDLSDPSLPAVAAGVREARLRGGGFTVLHVVPPPSAAGDFGPVVAPVGMSTPALAAEEEKTRHAIEARLRHVLTELGAQDAQVRVVVGSPGPAILEYAGELEAELIVVGSRGRTGIARVVLGSVAEEVVRTARVSVMAVRLSPDHG